MAELTLASTSPRRLDLLTAAGIVVNVSEPDVDEASFDSELDPKELVATLALAKAHSVAGERVLAADTVVSHRGRILGKPKNRNVARATLLAMSDSTVTVVSAVALIKRGGENSEQVETVTTTLNIRALSPAEVNEYVLTGASDDKAGSLAVQDQAASFVSEIDGCYSNVVGLPMCAVRRMLGLEHKDCDSGPLN